jgi:hypothetical protein
LRRVQKQSDQTDQGDTTGGGQQLTLKIAQLGQELICRCP